MSRSDNTNGTPTQTSHGNATRLEALAHHLENLDPHLLNMTTWGQQDLETGQPKQHNPNAPACAGTWTVRLLGDTNTAQRLLATPRNRAPIFEYARELLDITQHQADQLFMIDAWQSQARRITPRDAAQAIRDLSATGQVHWPDHRPLAHRIIAPRGIPRALCAVLQHLADSNTLITRAPKTPQVHHPGHPGTRTTPSRSPDPATTSLFPKDAATA